MTHTHTHALWPPFCRASLTPETERLLVAPLKVVMDHISEAFNQPRKARGAGRASTERMVWGKEGLGSWVASLAEQVRQVLAPKVCPVHRAYFFFFLTAFANNSCLHGK